MGHQAGAARLAGHGRRRPSPVAPSHRPGRGACPRRLPQGLYTGTFHGLTAAEREAIGRGLSAVAAPDATVLPIAWAPKCRGPLPRGTSRSEIAAAFSGWDVTDMGEPGFEAPKPVKLLMTPEERWYWLLRK